MARRTKIVATIGPASSSPEALGHLIDAGVNVFRLNCSHGTPDGHVEIAERIRKVAAERGRVIGILADLPGPKIRTTDTGEDGFEFVDKATIELRTGSEPSGNGRIYSDYPTLAQDLQSGDSVTLGDGGVDLRVVAVENDVVHAQVLNGGRLRGRPGLHLPADRVTLPVPTEEDKMIIEKVVLAADVDFVGVSFVRTAQEIRIVRGLLGDSGIRIVAKIETPAAIDNLEEIVEESDAVMVARGDLGTECPIEDVPIYQKRIIQTCLAYSKPVITATQMLESMISASTPTRAETSDVANAVCDGTDAIMLSGETAIGHNPALVVQTMARIAEAAEVVANFDRFAKSGGQMRQMGVITRALTHGAWYALQDAQVKAILCCTRSGATAHAMAALRPEAALLALSTSAQTVRQETLTWGAFPLELPPAPNSDAMVVEAVHAARSAGFVRDGDIVAVLSGGKDSAGSTDNLRLLTVSERVERV